MGASLGPPGELLRACLGFGGAMVRGRARGLELCSLCFSWGPRRFIRHPFKEIFGRGGGQEDVGIAGLSRGFPGTFAEVALGILWARLWASWGLFASWECHGAACVVLGRLLAVWGVFWGRKSWNGNLSSTSWAPLATLLGLS